MEQYRKDIGAAKLSKDTKQEVLQHLWRYPSLSIHGIEGAFSETGAKTVIPKKVIGKFSIRLVSDMDPQKTDQLVIKHLNDLMATRHSGNRFKASVTHEGGHPWTADFTSSNYQAAARGVQESVWRRS